MDGYTIKDLVTDYGQKTADDYLSRVRKYAENVGFELHEPAKMARIWIVRDGHKKKDTVKEKPVVEFETQSRKHISSMLFAMGRMEPDEMRTLPRDLFHGLTKIEGDTAIIDWRVEGLTDEIIARVEYCIGMKLIFTVDQGDLPF